MANPLNSPWLKPVVYPPTSVRFQTMLVALQQHCTNLANIEAYEHNFITIKLKKSITLYCAKNTDKFRLKSHLDWAYYTPKTLALAINNLDVDVYYERQLKHQQSDPNIWKRWDEEQDLKSYYAAREGRASLI